MARITPRISRLLNGFLVPPNYRRARLRLLFRKVWHRLPPRQRLRYLRQRRKLLNPYRSDA